MWSWIAEAAELARTGRPFAIATVASVSGSVPREVGAKMLVLGDGSFRGTIGGGQLERLVLDDAKRAIAQGKSQGVRYPLGPSAGQCCGGVVEVLVEVMNVGPELYIFGAGHVGQALASVLSATAFDVHLVDEREEWVAAVGVPAEVHRHCRQWDELAAQIAWDAQRTFVVIMTHQHDLDQELVHAFLDRPTRFLGMIGSAAKWRRFRERLIERGVSEALLARVRCPVGLPLGGKAPKEIAVSIAAEVLRVHYGNAESTGE